MKFRIKYADQVVGVFVILAFVLLALILVAMGGRQRWFARDYKYLSQFPSSTGVSVGTPLLYKGFQIGRINKVRLTPNNNVDVVFIVYDTFIDRVRKNSILELVVSPIGLGNQLLFHPGKTTELLPEGSLVPSFDTPEGKWLVDEGLVDRPPKDDTITRLISNINPLVENINATVVQLDKALIQVNGAMSGKGTGPVAEAIQNAADSVVKVKQLLTQVNQTLGNTSPRLDAILADVQTSVDSVKQLANSATVIGKNLEQTSESLKDPTGLIPKLLDPKGSLKTFLDDGNVLFNRVDNSLAQVEKSLTNLENTTATLADQMPRIAATIDEARSAIVSAQDVMEGLKNNPLLRGGIPEKVAPQAAPTGLRTTDF